MGFSVTSSKKDNITLVHVNGEVDMFTSPDLRDVLVPFFDADIKGIIVDLTHVSFMDSSGIATLVEGLQWSKRTEKKFILAGVGRTVANALSLTKLDNIFTICTDTPEAMEAFNH